METIGEQLGSVGDWFWNAVGTMIERLISEPSYRAGFFACLVAIIILGFLSSAISYALGRIQKFFSATKGPPAPSAGPTPVGITEGCAQGAVVLFVLALFLLYLLSRLVVP